MTERPVDILFLLDTTESMLPATRMARERIASIASWVFSRIPNVNIAFGVHGDFCDADSKYLYKFSPLVDEPGLPLLTEFLDRVEGTDGGDWDEAYGYVMSQAADFFWREFSQRHLVMVGDARFHPRGYTYGDFSDVWWEKALWQLGQNLVTVHAIQCLTSNSEEPWWRVMAEKSGGIWTKLSQFEDIHHALTAMVLRQSDSGDSLKSYLEEMEAADQLQNAGRQRLMSHIVVNTPALEVLVRVGWSPGPVESQGSPGSLSKLPDDFFQVLPVTRRQDIKGFVLANGAAFQAGRGFYELGPTVTVQEKKEVVLEHKLTGQFYAGDEARHMVGLPPGVRGKLSRGSLPRDIREDYNVFVQSTSYNRKLLPGTRFLYKPTKRRLS